MSNVYFWGLVAFVFIVGRELYHSRGKHIAFHKGVEIGYEKGLKQAIIHVQSETSDPSNNRDQKVEG